MYKIVKCLALGLALFTCCVNMQVLAKSSVLTIKLATTDWCPYACEMDKNHKGLAYDYVEYIFSKYDIQADIVSFPWARAIRQVNIGARHGLLTAVHSESPNLMFTSEPMMSYQMCFYGLPTSKWEYVDQGSLSEVLLAVISQYGYGSPVDDYLADQENTKKVIELSGDLGLQRLMSLVQVGRAEVFIEDKNVFNWFNKTHKLTGGSNFKQLGCLDETPFYLALSSELPWAKEVVKLLNLEFASKFNHNWLKQHKSVNYQ
ncbi:hypothetical protein L0668_20050 [Paraglaciecola aquimarina]|uniref:Solute-binding protein family 3/N-terminal domain-containing protein n=1 Tax=Paraglaciecola algarum TaxID=3050085 RepID=A0ABS9DBS6_9ALTE|nr:hypothetical protein [Paraglaciecola sp. G1-23]MCF2950413.1 hypothetical protein [Paraglaciecola sp. G1-23]